MKLLNTINAASIIRPFAVMFALYSASAAFAQTAKSADAVLAAWNSRSGTLRSVTVDWTEETTTPAGMQGRNKDGGPVPVHDITHSIQHRFLSDGKRVFWSRSGIQWDMDTHDFIQKDFKRSFDGNERRELFSDPGKTIHPAGGFLNDNGIFDGGDWHIQPLILTYRPLDVSKGGIDLKSWSISERHSIVHEVPCWALELQRGNSVVETLWLADTPDFRVMRREFTIGRALRHQLTIDYEKRADIGFACKSWSFIQFLEDGRVSESSVVSDAMVRVNHSIASSEFEFKFPPATLVVHERTKQMFVSRRDGTLRPVTNGERSAGISLDVLMETPPIPEATAGRRSTRSTLGIAILIGAMLVWWWRRRTTMV